MNKITFLASTLGFTLCLLVNGALADTAVIVHPSNNDAIDKDLVAKIFLGKVKSWPSGGNTLPVNLKEGADIRTKFDETVLEKSSSQVKSYWSKLMFTGKGTPPKEVDSGKEVKALIAENPATIGYIDASEVDSSVKVVFTF